MDDNSFVTIDFDPSSVRRYVAKNYNIVVVDVLRATSTIIVALSKGAKEIIPCVEIHEAQFYKQYQNALLIGERHAEIIPGFDFTNSPFDLSKEDLTDKTIAITTSTGTRVIAESVGAPYVLIGSTLNAQHLAMEMKKLTGKWAVIGAGTRGDFRLEDQVGCALIASYYMKLTGAFCDENSKRIIQTYTKNLKTHIFNSLSAHRLVEIGRKCDVDFVISALNQYNIAPEVRIKKQGRLKQMSITANPL